MNQENPMSMAMRHALGWLLAANGVGLWLAALLCWPELGSAFGEQGYGRWLPLHLNGQLYGWTSLPLIAWMFFCYRVDTCPTSARFSRGAVVLWTTSLLSLGLSCLLGTTSGKIFLDWKGPALWIFLATQLWLWLALALGYRAHRASWSKPQRLIRMLVLLGLLTVPVSLWITTSPSTYPPIDPSTGGPTGASLLGSTLIVVAMMLALPHTLGLPATWRHTRGLVLLWSFEMIAFVLLEWRGGSHHDIAQIAGLALLLPWMILIPRYWSQATWPEQTKSFRRFTYLWWCLLVLTGWLEFLPGILDRMKFTNGLVAHAHMAMAGFTSSYLLMMMVMMGGKRAAISLTQGQRMWHVATAVYVISMMLAGWCEGAQYAWMSESPWWREGLYLLRFGCGIVMTYVSWRWWRAFSQSSDV